MGYCLHLPEIPQPPRMKPDGYAPACTKGET